MDGSTGQNLSLESRQTLAASLLGKLADEIEISEAQFQRAKTAYETVGAVLQKSRHSTLAAASVFPQGSFAIGTTIKPVDRDDGEFDVDLACRLDASSSQLRPDVAKTILGDSLKNDGRYAGKLEEKSRCWRINYSGDFHLDVCPLVTVSDSTDAIPDKELSTWIHTAPAQYAAWFNHLADTVRTRSLNKGIALDAQIDPFPDANPNKGWLRRVVQLLKRHRDQWRMDADDDLHEFAPISVILTTLSARVVQRDPDFFRQSEEPYRVIKKILDELPLGIERRVLGGRDELWVRSPVAEENFANRWKEDSRWLEAFGYWLDDARASVQQLVMTHGLDSGKQVLAENFGAGAAGRVFTEYGSAIRAARDKGELKVARAGLGLAVTGTTVKKHTFFGD